MRSALKLTIDLSLTVLLPIVMGIAIYLSPAGFVTPAVRNHLPDFCWAFAFLSMLLIIWSRELPARWMVLAAITTVVYEAGQGLGWINGTFDWLDLLAYALGFALAYALNRVLVEKRRTID